MIPSTNYSRIIWKRVEKNLELDPCLIENQKLLSLMADQRLQSIELMESIQLNTVKLENELNLLEINIKRAEDTLSTPLMGFYQMMESVASIFKNTIFKNFGMVYNIQRPYAFQCRQLFSYPIYKQNE